MLATLGQIVTIVGFVGMFACIAGGFFYNMRYRVDTDMREDSQRKSMIVLAASVCFFMLALLGAILTKAFESG